MSENHSIAVRCRNVTKEFGQGTSKVLALRGVDLDVREGEMSLLVGPSGCGKTTLLSVVAGIMEPTGGKVEVMGTDLSKLSPAQTVAFRGKQIGFVFQQFNLLPALSAAENVAVPLLIAGRPRRLSILRGREMLERLGLGRRANALPATLSGGEQQRVAIGRALIHEPALLVCDEPTSALDAENGRIIMDLLKSVAVQSGRAVIVVTHDARVFAFGDRIAYMDDGHIVKVEERSPDQQPALAH